MKSVYILFIVSFLGSTLFGEAYVGASYEVVDGMGRPIERGVITATTQSFDLADKPKGVYRIALTKNDKRKTLIVVIQ